MCHSPRTRKRTLLQRMPTRRGEEKVRAGHNMRFCGFWTLYVHSCVAQMWQDRRGRVARHRCPPRGSVRAAQVLRDPGPRSAQSSIRLETANTACSAGACECDSDEEACAVHREEGQTSRGPKGPMTLQWSGTAVCKIESPMWFGEKGLAEVYMASSCSATFESRLDQRVASLALRACYWESLRSFWESLH